MVNGNFYHTRTHFWFKLSLKPKREIINRLTKMDDKNTYLHVLLLLNIIAVSSYLQFVDPGETEADSSSVHVGQFPSGPYPFWPNRTVDGNFSQGILACLHTAVSGITEAWLRIDLQAVRSIKSVKFWYRNDRGSQLKSTVRLRGYSIRVSNTSDVPPGSGEACFTDNSSSTLPTVIQEDCKRTTKYVWFYQPKVISWNDKVPILEICEVQIFGCKTGTFDDSCTKTCSHCKNSETCDIDNGQCDDNGCALQGFKPPTCTECRPGSYGSFCSLNCSSYCEKKACDRYSRECLYGCTPGYQMPNCVMPCMHGYYGENCTKKCGNCLNDETCNNINGTCSDGCSEGFKGNLCITTCSPGEYGRSCQFRCSDQCYNNEVCDAFFGNCSKCSDGFQNAKCNEQCDDGTYGESCMFQCGDCLDDITCNNINGTCPSGCMSGWQNTEKCDKPCANGNFGVGCKLTCSGNCLNNDTCEKSNGGCRKCAPGWEGHLCNKGVLRSTQDSDTPYVAVIAVLVVVIVVLVTALAVHVVILRNTRKKLETNSRINEAEMYDLPNAKTENSLYDVISN